MKVSLSRIVLWSSSLLLVAVGTLVTGCGGDYCDGNESSASSPEPVTSPDESASSDPCVSQVEEVDRGAKPIE